MIYVMLDGTVPFCIVWHCVHSVERESELGTSNDCRVLQRGALRRWQSCYRLSTLDTKVALGLRLVSRDPLIVRHREMEAQLWFCCSASFFASSAVWWSSWAWSDFLTTLCLHHMAARFWENRTRRIQRHVRSPCGNHQTSTNSSTRYTRNINTVKSMRPLHRTPVGKASWR